jgi:uncharacterized protein YceH (UPF0502 family)
MNPIALLSLLETRVLGVLVEKEHTVPDTYPLSLNSLVSGCNQKNNRSPVIEARDAEVQAVIESLRGRSMVIESSGARVARYSHNVGRVLRVPPQSVALLAVLMLRGPQTAAELRTGTERMHRFADVSSVEGFLVELSERSAEAGGPLVVKLDRAPGERESRWAHLLSGPVEARREASPGSDDASPSISLSEYDALRTLVAQQTSEIADLRAKVERMAQELGIRL